MAEVAASPPKWKATRQSKRIPFSDGEIKNHIVNLPIWVSTQATKFVKFEPEMVKDWET